ncbi:hypothetical protein AB6A40_008930 [Gnathostoma spinigerum]|uniref:Uncharacterized protein n=1 Tax=Gnathostoma spinigerum TaxID=75299 RepID=A0ABD6EQV2_9BILA
MILTDAGAFTAVKATCARGGTLSATKLDQKSERSTDAEETLAVRPAVKAENSIAKQQIEVTSVGGNTVLEEP